MKNELCDFTSGLKCPRCGYIAKQERTFRVCQTLDEIVTHAVRATSKPWIAVPNPMLGDRVAAALAYFGITKGRVSRAVGRECGCEARQAGLNLIGGAIAIAIEKTLDGAASAMIGDRDQEMSADAIRQQILEDPSVNPGIKTAPKTPLTPKGY